MTFKNRILKSLFLAVSVVVLSTLFTGCGAVKKVDDIEVTSVNLKSFSPNGLKAVDAILEIGVDNPTFAFKLSDIEGIVYYNGDEIATYAGGPISVKAKSSDLYELPCSLKLSPSFSLFTIVKIVSNGNLEGLTTDVKAKASLKNGLSKTFKYEDMPIQDLLND